MVDVAGTHAWSELGIRAVGYSNFNPTWQSEGAGVWLATDYDWTANTFDPDPLGSPTLDLDDKLILQKGGGWGEGSYNLPGPPPTNPGNNHRVWFDRDGVDQWQAQSPLAVNGGTYNTGGLYDVVIALSHTSATQGKAYMTINGLAQGFEVDGNWNTMELSPAGMTFTGDMTAMQVFYGLYGYGATHSATFKDTEVSGCMVLAEEGMVTGGGWFESPSGAYRMSFSNGFEIDTSGWFDYGGSITRVASGTNGVTSAGGNWHAEIRVGPSDGYGAFTRFGSYSSVFPTGGFSQLVDVYIDPAMSNIGEGWALDNALNDNTGNWLEAGGVGAIKVADGKWWLAADGDGAGYPGPVTGGVGLMIDTAGWYTIESQWIENSDDPSKIDRNTFIYNSSGTLLYSNYNPKQVSLASAGGNRYGWFLAPSGPIWPPIQFPLPIDNSRLMMLAGVDGPTGRASFGFVSQYKKGAYVPTGQTEFVFKAGDLNFHSDSYDWLVVAGAMAMYKGIGTINGQGGYKFLLTAIDADVNNSDSFDIDRFRIKIWYELGGTDYVVYDNAFGDDSDSATTEIAGGSIVVHKPKR